MKVTGKIEQIKEVEKGTSKEGKDWQKLNFTIKTTEQYNNLYAFEIFGKEKIENFLKYNKVGNNVDVDFNVQTREWKDKFFTTLQCWKIFKAAEETKKEEIESSEKGDDLPF